MKTRRIPGCLEQAAAGEGLMCPKCKTFAPKGREGKCWCPVCGQEVVKVSLEERSRAHRQSRRG